MRRRLTDFFLHDLPGTLPADHTRDWIPGGYLGTVATIERMKEFVTEYKRNFEIRKLAAKIIANCPAKDYYCYARAIYEWCRDRIKYVYDPHMVELVESPTRVLESGIADCDSICTLLGALNESIGLKTRFRTIRADSKRPDDFSHVYCMVRVPASRFSSTRISGWIAEDPTLPDKQFGWEPKGPQVLGHKDWPASKDKDGEDDDVGSLGGLGEMNPQNETEAQLEINRLCNALNQKLVCVLRKGLEYSDPEKAQVIMVGVSKVTGQAAMPTSPSQKLGAVRNGYAYWSGVIDQHEGSIPDMIDAPTMSGYTALGDFLTVREAQDAVPGPMGGMGGILDYLFGGPKTETLTPQEAALSRMNAYIVQIGERITRLKDFGANAYYPTQLQQLANYLSDMRQLAAYGDPDATKREPQVLAIYKTAVTMASNVAQAMDDLGHPVDKPASLDTIEAQGRFEIAEQTYANLPEWLKVPLAPVMYPIFGYPEGQQGAAPLPYPEQQQMAQQKPSAQTTQPFKPSVPSLPDESLIYPREDPTTKWLKDNALILGVGAAALVGAILYFRKRATSPVSSNPRLRKKKGKG